MAFVDRALGAGFDPHVTGRDCVIGASTAITTPGGIEDEAIQLTEAAVKGAQSARQN